MEIGYIYKITSPNKRVYIGQTVNPKKRFRDYKALRCEKQIKLYNSFLKHGFDNHKFEVVIECDRSELNKYERYYQDLFHCLSKSGLNLRLTSAEDRVTVISDESRAKMRLVQKEVMETKRKNGIPFFTESTLIKMAASRKANPRVLSQEAKDHLRMVNTGLKKTEETKMKISLAKKGKKTKPNSAPRSDEHKRRHSEKMKGRLGGENSICSHVIINTETGIYYFGAREATLALGRYTSSHVNDMLAGFKTNKTSLKRV